jgi:hypothetical protein
MTNERISSRNSKCPAGGGYQLLCEYGAALISNLS